MGKLAGQAGRGKGQNMTLAWLPLPGLQEAVGSRNDHLLHPTTSRLTGREGDNDNPQPLAQKLHQEVSSGAYLPRSKQ